MKLLQVLALIFCAICLPHASSGPSHRKDDFAQACYGIPLPDLPASPDNRTIPWAAPSIGHGNSTCCSSLDDVRTAIDTIDLQLLELLSQRAAYVREASRFKATRYDVEAPSRDQEIIQGAVLNASAVQLPQTMAEAVFTSIINSSSVFELCIFDSFHGRGH
ncbi:hypothetical protein CVT26_008551 [Gymnopilus dilepis]|uniref:Chorismate mutase domain-containing protein n=1 Tax=Gymnopilus dilepis TaxID=231916 RepID=A0A409XXR3_9AGAR|nr:hypothetical protein CVT26_008551 [Gymnopilus dilepis]